jgi:hypothetical protein
LELSECFAASVCGFAVMDNHLHVLVRLVIYGSNDALDCIHLSPRNRILRIVCKPMQEHCRDGCEHLYDGDEIFGPLSFVWNIRCYYR